MSIDLDAREYRYRHRRNPVGTGLWSFDIRATFNQPQERERFSHYGDFQQAARAAQWHAASVLGLTSAIVKVMP